MCRFVPLEFRVIRLWLLQMPTLRQGTTYEWMHETAIKGNITFNNIIVTRKIMGTLRRVINWVFIISITIWYKYKTLLMNWNRSQNRLHRKFHIIYWILFEHLMLKFVILRWLIFEISAIRFLYPICNAIVIIFSFVTKVKSICYEKGLKFTEIM